MKAYLYDVKRYYCDEEYPHEDEFIVVSDNELKRKMEAERVYEWYVQNSKENLEKSVLGEPQFVEDDLYLENSKKEIHWEELQERHSWQHEHRPRGISCVFRGGALEPVEDLSNEDIKDLKKSIEYFMDEHRAKGCSYLFVSSKWKLDGRRRYGKIAVFEASSIKLASDIAQLEFLSHKCETIFINWCCPIYVV